MCDLRFGFTECVAASAANQRNAVLKRMEVATGSCSGVKDLFKALMHEMKEECEDINIESGCTTRWTFVKPWTFSPTT